MSAPPNDPSAEAAVLGALLYAQTGVSLDEIPDLAADAFYSGRNRRIFAAIRELHGEGEPVDVVTVVTGAPALVETEGGCLLMSPSLFLILPASPL